jgi:protein-L-isoaspartate(D-aspartate) O-methyltransferase
MSLGPNPRLAGRGMTSQRSRARMIELLREAGVAEERVLAVIAEIPRHLFVEPGIESRAYDDTALPIGFGQTISSPVIVGLMTQMIVAGRPTLGKVLEIGTGCGYQTAVLGKLFPEVFTVERIARLTDIARRNLRDLRYYNVRFKHADGNLGYADGGPYDAIIVTAACPEMPLELTRQLAVGGRLVAPIDIGREGEQRLLIVDRTADGVRQHFGDFVRFVPLLPGTTP